MLLLSSRLNFFFFYIMRWLWVYGLRGKVIKFECEMLPTGSCVWTFGLPVVELFEKVVEA